MEESFSTTPNACACAAPSSAAAGFQAYSLTLSPCKMCSGSEAGSYLKLIDSCITQLKAQGPSRTRNESKERRRMRVGGPSKTVHRLGWRNPSRRHQMLALPPHPMLQGLGRCKATWKRDCTLPWREAGRPNHPDDKVESEQ